ncbi:MAG: M36 family metallopeptidase [Pyrinomonadaceae bacterium]
MRRTSYRFLSLLLMCAVMLQGLLGVAITGIGQTQDYRNPLQEFYRKFGRDWIVRLSEDGQRIESILGKGTQAYRGKPADAARQFLRENARLFGLKEDLSDLNVLVEKSTPGGGSVEFQQIYNNLPVENARVQVNLNKEGRVIQVSNFYTPTQDAVDQAAISKEQATENAVNEFLRTTPAYLPPKNERASRSIQALSRAQLQLKEAPKVEDLFFVQSGRPVRAYRVQINSARPFGVKEFVVDANSGAILQVKDRIHTFIDGKGQVFIPNPVNSKNNNTYTDSGAGGTAVPTSSPNPYYRVPLWNLSVPAGGPYTLQGPFSILQDIDTPSNTPPTETAAPDFIYLHGNPQFDDVMIYYHIDRIQRYIQSLGFVDVNNRQIAVDSDGVEDDPATAKDESDNSFYGNSPLGLGHLSFGHGGIDDAEDADVIAHEYGHAIQANQTQDKYDGNHNSFNSAMGEGFGDYWAVSSFYNETKASGHDQPCVMEWDQVPGCLRRTDSTLTAANFDATVATGEEHNNGVIWSSTLYDILLALDKTTADRLILQSHFNVPNNPKFKDGADAIMTADLQLYSGSHLSQLCTVFTNRKIYQATDCPSVPPPVGTNQNTLVILAKFKDLPSATPIGAGDAATLINNINSYLKEVTYDKASLGAPTTQGWIDLPRNRADYYNESTGNMLIEMVQDVIPLMPAGFDFSPFDRMLILTNDDGSGGVTGGLKEWATTGPWPYKLPAAFGTKRLSVSIHRADQAATNVAQFTHAMGHHFGLIDLYPHEGVNFPRPYADGWSNMAKDSAGNFNNTHFFGWDKLRPTWLTDANVQFIPRPPADPDVNHKFEDTFPIFREETNTSNPVLIQVATTPGSTRATERVSYYIEARKKAGSFDNNIPSDGVLIYYLNEDIAQGFGPLRLVDATPGDNDVSNAALKPASDGGPAIVDNIDGTGLRVEVQPKMGAEDYRVHITYDPPDDQVDVWINPHDENWDSPDIWIDSPNCNGENCGFDKDAAPARTEEDRGDKPAALSVGQPGAPPVNRVYARVYNHGPDTAHNVRVDFYFSDPYQASDGGTIDPDTGSNIAFQKHFFKVLDDVPKTDTGIPVFVDWTPVPVPAGQPQVHSCIKVKIAKVLNDTNEANQASQENIVEYDISKGSPYPPVVNNFKVFNPYDHPILVYLRADNVPVGWTTVIEPEKALLPVGGIVEAKVTIQAPQDYPVCSSEFIKVSAWYPSGDTLIELGANTAKINLKTSTALNINMTYESCEAGTEIVKAHPQSLKKCKALKAKGCTNPARPFEHISVQYTGPDGKPIYHDVVTDANGCFEDFLVNPQGGLWNVQAEYPGNDCASSTQTGLPRNPVFVPPGGGQEDTGRGRLWLSFHLGANFPLGSFNQTHNPGPSMTLNLEYPFRDDWAIVGYLGFHFFHGDHGNKNFYYTNLSVNLRKYFPVSNFHGYVEAGPGFYLPKTGPKKLGFNVGAGLSFPIPPKLKIELGPDFHFVDPSGAKRVFVDARIGVAFRF